jgi:phosphatidylserine decarboxylase
MTGQLEEEKMQVYVRLGIRLLYKVRCSEGFSFPCLTVSAGDEESHGRRTRYVLPLCCASRLRGRLARRLLKSLSIKQGIKYDSPESARDIPTFIEFHKLKVDEILDPLDSFSMSTRLLPFCSN